jgi:hypothetical protein
MRIKSFDNFINESQYTNYYEAKGKSGFSRWLRRVGNRIGLPEREVEYSSYYSNDSDAMSTLKSASNVIALSLKGLTKGSAAFFDLITPKSPDSTKSEMKDLSKSEIEQKRKEAFKKWEDEKLSGKVTDEDAEKFFKSGVLKGKQHFGSDYNVLKPRNSDEELYGDYLRDLMNSYYRGVRRSG